MIKDFFNIRLATVDDISIIVDMNIGIALETEGKELNRSILFQGVEMAISRPSLSSYFVAESSESIVGQTMVTYEWSDWRAGQIWWLQSVYVIPKFRGKGCFKAIYLYIKNLAKRSNFSKAIRLYVMNDNEVGKRVYSKLGMNQSNYLIYEDEFD